MLAPAALVICQINKPETQQYLADLCAECASLGFDEILLDQFTYPTVGRLDRLQTGDVEKTAVLAALTVRLREGEYSATGRGSDPDIIVASAKAYIDALNRLDHKERDALRTQEATGEPAINTCN